MQALFCQVLVISIHTPIGAITPPTALDIVMDHTAVKAVINWSVCWFDNRVHNILYIFVSVTVAICKSCTRSAGQHGRIVNPTGGVSVVQTGQQQGGPGGYHYGHPQMNANVGYHHGYPPPQPMNAYGPPHPQPMNGPPPPPAYVESRPEVNQPPPVSTAFGGEPSTK
ncbi:unnamed protein product [Mytilus edulis]|uniref:Uncharacterized protein n=1 Tax=Mytilus edulis TaxID=6550 RepID=A0A8S3TXD7_MYTED|nr:unnamed protein product [Mytilus edulis]